MKHLITQLILASMVYLNASAMDAPITFSRVYDEGNANSQLMVININDEHYQLYHVDRNPALDYRDIERATLSESRNGSPMIELLFTESGKEKLSKLTTESLKKAIAIQIEGELIAAPIVMNPITGGKIQVISSFSTEYAKQFVSELNARIAQEASLM